MIPNFGNLNLISPSMKKILFSLIAVFFLASCSLAEDITPPPGFQAQTNTRATPVSGHPTAVPTSASVPQVNLTPVDVSSAFPTSLPSPAAGAALFAKNCTRCHGTTGAGDGQLKAQIPFALPDFTKPDLARTTTPHKWFTTITNGNIDRMMPPWQTLSDADRWNLVSYLYTLSAPATQTEAGRKVYEANCQKCHGVDGKSGNPEVKVSFVEQKSIVKKSNNDLFESIGKVSAHKLDAVNETDRRAAVDYIRSLSYDAAATVKVEQGTITGKLTNSTPSGKIPGDQAVVLNIFDNFKPTDAITITAKADGSFVFNDVKMNEGRAFIISTKYNDIVYVSDVVSVAAGKNQYDAPIQIFETTNDVTAVRIEQMHVVMEFDGTNVLVGQLFVISNLGDRAYAAAKAGDPTLNFSLPSGYKDLQFEDGILGGRYKQTADGFADTQPVRPGTGNYQIVVQYSLPYNDALSFAQKIFYTTNNFSLLLPDAGITVSGGGLVDKGVQDIQGTKFRSFTLSGAKAGDVIKFDLKGKPTFAANAPAAASTSDTTTAIIGGVTLGLALSLVGLYYWNSIKQPGLQTVTVKGGKSLSKRREELIAELADLDEGFEKGEYPEAEYKTEREKLKAELRKIIAAKE